MFIPIPMKISKQSGSGSPPVANWILVALNIIAYFLVSPEYMWVGPGTGLLSLVTYAFAHADFTHLVFNMWYLWIFGNAVNRRIGNRYYVLTCLGTILAIGILGRVLSSGYLLGASGVVFAVLALTMLLMPSARVMLHYLAFFPLTILMGLFRKPKYGLYWFVRWGSYQFKALMLIVLFVILELSGFFWWGLNWTNLGHLLGFVCGIAAALLLPTRITMKYRMSAFTR